jgi:protein-S-isoprenylcysteine O-methyltransferase Ste14
MEGAARMERSRLGRYDDTFFANLGEKLFEWRDYTPIPLILIVLIFATPTSGSATLGTLVVVLGELIRLYSVAFIGAVSRTRNVATTGDRLVTHGPFGVVRNPLYVGNFLITIGFSFYSGELWIVGLAFLMFAFQYHAIVKFEERLLIARFGRDFDDYRQTVPAWLPRRLPSLSSMEWPDTFSPALYSERRTLLAIVVMLVALILVSG